MTVKLYRGTRLRSKRSHYTMSAGLWLYTFLWLAGLGANAYWYRHLGLIYKALLLITLVIGTPAVQDLLYSYSKYEEEWRRDNEQDSVQAEEPEAR